MEKMKRRSTWMRIMAVMLAVVIGITMMPLDTLAATETESSEIIVESDNVTPDGLTNKDWFACVLTSAEYNGTYVTCTFTGDWLAGYSGNDEGWTNIYIDYDIPDLTYGVSVTVGGKKYYCIGEGPDFHFTKINENSATFSEKLREYSYISQDEEIASGHCYIGIIGRGENVPTNVCKIQYVAANTVTPPIAKTGLVYNAQTQTGVEAGTGYTLTGNTAKDAGDYTAKAKLQNGYTWTDGSTDSKEIAGSIAPAELTEVTLTETVFYYNGEVQRPDVTEVKAGDLIVPSEDYTVVYEGGDTKDPGTYRVLVRWEFGKNNVTGVVWATYEIKKTVVPPIAKPGLVYNGREQTGVEPGEGYTLTGNTGKDAGDYTAEASLEDGYTWTDGSTGKKNIKWSI